MPDDAIELKEYKPEELYKMSYQELIEVAKTLGVKYQGKPKRELVLELGGGPEDAIVYDDSAEISPAEVKEMKEGNEQIPGKRVWWKKDDDKVWRILEKNPVAFYKTDLTDPAARIVHLFDTKKVKCICGEDFKMEREYEVKAMQKEPVMRKEATDIKFCPRCGRKYILHVSGKEVEVAQ